MSINLKLDANKFGSSNLKKTFLNKKRASGECVEELKNCLPARGDADDSTSRDEEIAHPEMAVSQHQIGRSFLSMHANYARRERKSQSHTEKVFFSVADFVLSMVD